MAPAASIVLVEAEPMMPAIDISRAAQTAASLPGVSVVSMSWGESEYSGETSDRRPRSPRARASRSWRRRASQGLPG